MKHVWRLVADEKLQRFIAWKGSKWVCRLELLTADVLGFWEARGYSNTARPWRNDRYG